MIGGNITALFQASISSKNAIGEPVQAWITVAEIPGFLDMQSGDSKYTNYNAKIQESTHIFIADYLPIPETFSFDGKDVRVNTENARMVANSQSYDVMLIDNPMGLNQQLEIYLKYTGGQ